ncbi:MAG: hypothetical protein HYU52_12895 [Acidobacteria bacterium]|nr:hypothetical protein [Acidobacteriota bacterium]
MTTRLLPRLSRSRSRQHALIFACAVLLVALSAGATDLTVGWISRLPEVDYVWNSEHPDIEGWPAEDEVVTWRGHLRCWTDEDLDDVRYVWKLDGTVIAKGEVDLQQGQHAEVDISLPWSFQRRSLTLAVDVANAVAEESESNNELTVFTDALSVAYYVEQSLYDFFRANQYRLKIGSTSFENWAQRTIERYNDMAALAVYPETPDGVFDRWRLQKIVIVPDRALPLVPLPNFGEMGGEPNAATHPNKDDRSVDLQWGFTAELARSFSDLETVSLANPFYSSRALLHELGHARYLTDVYGWNLLIEPKTTISLVEDGNLVAGSRYLPVVDGYLYKTEELGLMNAEYSYIDRYSAILLNRIAHRRAVRGNYNEPENIAEYLNDLPEKNEVTIYERSGAPVRNAVVQIFRSEGESDHWYALNFDASPDMNLTTDANGVVELGRCPFSADGKVVHTWRHSNVLTIVRVKPEEGDALYGVLESRVFNLAYWRGETDVARHELVVGPGGCALAEPLQFQPGYAARTSAGASFSWSSVGATTYEVWVALPGEKPKLWASTSATSVPMGIVDGDVFWWVVAKRKGCRSSRSMTWRFRAYPRIRPARR